MALFGPPNIDRLKRKGDVNGLLKAVSHKDPAIQVSAENALSELGTAITRPLMSAALHAWTEKVRRAATETLRKLGTAGVEGIITNAIQEEHPIDAAELLTGLGELEAEVVEALIARLEDKDVGTRWWAASALGEMKADQAAEALIAALEDEDENVREVAAGALKHISGPQAEQALARYRAQE